MADLRQQQISGENIEQVTGNGSGKDYKISKHEAHLVHARIGTPRFDPATGEDKGVYAVQVFSPADFQQMKDSQAFAGRKVEILHDGGAPVEGVEPQDSLVSKIVSEPGAGLPVGVDYNEMSKSELQKAYAKLVPGDKNPPKTKGDLIESIRARSAFLADEEQQKQAAGIDRNRLGADAEKKEQEAMKSATADVKKDVPGPAVTTPPVQPTGSTEPAPQAGQTASGELFGEGPEREGDTF